MHVAVGRTLHRPSCHNQLINVLALGSPCDCAAEILEVTGQSSKEGAYMMTIGVFVACFCMSTFVRHRMMGTKMSLFGGGPQAAVPAAAATTKQESANNGAGKSKKKSKKAD
eukprot:COSAG03_NODE_2435_length_2771_cov_1.879117_1_plen_112_part_00